jgi:hypothetical protein
MPQKITALEKRESSAGDIATFLWLNFYLPRALHRVISLKKIMFPF